MSVGIIELTVQNVTALYYTEDEVQYLLKAANLVQNTKMVFVLLSSCFIFLLKMGFAMLQAGTVRTKNSSNVLLNNLLDNYIGAIIYYLVGYGLANNSGGG